MDFFIKPLIFLGCIVLGIVLKQTGFFGPTDYRVIVKIVFNITLPLAIVRSFETFVPSSQLFYLIGLGLFCATLPFFMMAVLVRQKTSEEQIFMLLNSSGYNIGTFTLPLMLGFFGPFGGIVTVMFDIGNAVMMTGGAYALTTNYVPMEQPKPTLKETLQNFTRSMPFMTYMLMMFVALSGIKLPTVLFQLITPLADSNSFLSMLMIGMMFKWSVSSNDLKTLSKLLVFRYAVASLFALLIYFFLPLDDFIKKIMMIVVFAPIGGLSAVYLEKCKGNVGLSSFIGSISILISLVIMSVLAFIFS